MGKTDNKAMYKYELKHVVYEDLLAYFSLELSVFLNLLLAQCVTPPLHEIGVGYGLGPVCFLRSCRCVLLTGILI